MNFSYWRILNFNIYEKEFSKIMLICCGLLCLLLQVFNFRNIFLFCFHFRALISHSVCLCVCVCVCVCFIFCVCCHIDIWLSERIWWDNITASRANGRGGKENSSWKKESLAPLSMFAYHLLSSPPPSSFPSLSSRFIT